MRLPPERGTTVRLLTLTALAGPLLTAGCGSVASAPQEAAARPVQLKVQPARFSATTQLPGDRVRLSITITNTGSTKVDNLVVSLEGNEPAQLAVRNVDDNPNDIPQGTTDLPATIKRAAWFIDDGPQHAPIAGGDSWSAGSLDAGRTTTVRWTMVAITPGRHTLTYYVAGGLTDKAAKATTGTGLTGKVAATIAKPGDDQAATADQ
ncbi:MAG: hypothetical protein QM679_06850 [Patulibacter sp.]